MVPVSAAPCHVDFLLVPHNNLAEVRLPNDAVPRHRLHHHLHHGDRFFTPCLPSTCSRACVQSPCGSLRFITLTFLYRGEVAVVGHCKFAEMLYSSDELVVVVCFVYKTAFFYIHYVYRAAREVRLCALPLRLRGRHGLRTLFLSVASASTTGSNRCVPPPRGSSSPAHLGLSLLPPLAVRLFFFSRRLLMPRGAACGFALPVLPLSLLLVLHLLPLFRLLCLQYLSGSGRTFFPDCDCRALQGSHCLWFRSCLLVPGSLCQPGRPDVFSGRVHVPLGGLAEQGQLVHCVRGNGSHLACNFAYSGEEGRWFDVVSRFGGCRFPAGKAIIEIIEPPFQLACSFLVPERGGAISRSSAESWIVEFHGFPAGAHSGKVPRPPAVVDSSTALAFNGTASRPPLWVDSPAGV